MQKQNMSLSLNKVTMISRPLISSVKRRSSMAIPCRRHQQFSNHPVWLSTDDDKRASGVVIETETLPLGLRRDKMPRHVALIPDGNRRWAVNRGLPKVYGYHVWFDRITEIMEVSLRCGIDILSVFAFSEQNFNRPQNEVDYFFKNFEKFLQDLNLRFSRQNVRISTIEDVGSLPKSLQETIRRIEDATSNNSQLHVMMAIGYGGREDILQACRSLSRKAKVGVIEPDGITAAVLEEKVQTNDCRFPSPDLIIRTSGEQRVSNFMLWQSAYTELFFTDQLMPDFGQDHFFEALDWFQRRSRRFGR